MKPWNISSKVREKLSKILELKKSQSYQFKLQIFKAWRNLIRRLKNLIIKMLLEVLYAAIAPNLLDIVAILKNMLRFILMD